MDNKIKLILDDSGQIKSAHKDFNLYQGAVGTVGIEIYVPREMLNTPMVADDDTVVGSNAVTIYAVATSETGKRITSPAEQCNFLRKENLNGIEYWVFTRITGLPKGFLRYAGDLTICASIFRLHLADDGSTKLESRSKIQMFKMTVLPNPDGDLDPEYEPSELAAVYDLLNSTILTLNEIYGADGKAGTVYGTPAIDLTSLEQNKSNRLETVLKHDLRKPLPKYFNYDKNGYKTPGVLFMNETHTVPTDVKPAINLETVTGALLVSNICPDVEQPEMIAWQNEIFYHEKGNSARKIKLDISQFKETGVITTLDVGEWKVQNYAWFNTTSQQIVALDKRVQDLEYDYVSKELNAEPLEEKEEFEVTETGALQQTTTKRDIRTGEKSTVTVTPIPVTENKARLIQPQEIQSLRQLIDWQATLSGEALNYLVDLSDLPKGETQSETVQKFLTEKYQEVTETPDTILDQVTLHDEVLGMAFRWYENNQAWVLSQGSLAGKATNNTYDQNGNLTEQGNVGGVVGSNKEGHIFFETNGEGAVVGFDALKEQTTNNAQAIADESENRKTAMGNEAETRATADAAINAIIGVLAELTTRQKDTLVNALNSLKNETNTNAAAILTEAETRQSQFDQSVKITGDQDIAGIKNFTGTFQIKGGTIKYDPNSKTFIISDNGNLEINGSELTLNPTNTNDDARFELGGQRGVAKAAIIDFHSGATPTDYDVRLISTGGDGSSGGGTLNIRSKALNLNNERVTTVADKYQVIMEWYDYNENKDTHGFVDADQNGNYNWTNNNEYPVIAYLILQSYNGWIQVNLDGKEVFSTPNLTNSERSIVSCQVFVPPGSTLSNTGANPNGFRSNLYWTKYHIKAL